MSSDSPKIEAAAPTPQPAEERTGSSALVLLVAAFAGTISSVWGFEANACNGFIAGAIGAVMRATFLAFTHVPELAFQLALLFIHLGIAHIMARRRPFRRREELLTMVLPIASFVAGWATANTTWVERTCALHPWA